MVKLVNQTTFAAKIKDKKLPIFTAINIRTLFGVSAVAASALLYRYKKRGFVLQIKRGLYKLSDEQVPDLYMANKIYAPSYVSLEFALSYHGVIPETGYEIQKQKGFSFIIADPEKAFVDSNYFRMLGGLKPISRLDKEKINPEKALRYAKLFGNSKLISIVKTTLQ